jgi:hypothetical protein
MQEVATGKYHGHSFGGLNGGPSYRCHYNLYFVAMPLVSYWHKADIARLSSDVRFWGKADINKRLTGAAISARLL